MPPNSLRANRFSAEIRNRTRPADVHSSRPGLLSDECEMKSLRTDRKRCARRHALPGEPSKLMADRRTRTAERLNTGRAAPGSS